MFEKKKIYFQVTLKKKNLVTRSFFIRDLKFQIWGLEIKFVKNYFFLENYVNT